MDPNNQTPQNLGPNGQNNIPSRPYTPPQPQVYVQQSNAAPPQQQIQPQMSKYIPPAGPSGAAIPVPAGMMPTPKPKKSKKLLFGFVLVTFLLIVFVILAVVFYGQMQDYKTNSDQKSSVAVEQAKKDQEKQLNEQFAEKEKEPLKSYTGPANAAAVKIVYPKTWSLYTVEGPSGDTLSSYFNPNLVPNVSNKDNLYALRLNVLEQPYANILRTFESKVTKGEVKVTPFVASNVKDAETGVRIDGAITNNTIGSMVLIPVRDKTIQLWTESGNYTADFDNFVLKNLTFNP
ncbi:hypothetical protein KBC85_01180 [Candidatus Saccharibacteria bacterium]|nr:hypothetical protein [Candidatus Saccharibacteria bacterium]MDQ5885572.1 hypothetical protein [Patescibacteria group bacterium]MDQ5953562.1 hypothetical protein [Patescibacteria group bacterium]MDQ5958768.1 hypothetical protein [Patescibacteria group bacterium]